jgi:hypothetical protein
MKSFEVQDMGNTGEESKEKGYSESESREQLK